MTLLLLTTTQEDSEDWHAKNEKSYVSGMLIFRLFSSTVPSIVRLDRTFSRNPRSVFHRKDTYFLGSERQQTPPKIKADEMMEPTWRHRQPRTLNREETMKKPRYASCLEKKVDNFFCTSFPKDFSSKGTTNNNATNKTKKKNTKIKTTDRKRFFYLKRFFWIKREK